MDKFAFKITPRISICHDGILFKLILYFSSQVFRDKMRLSGRGLGLHLARVGPEVQSPAARYMHKLKGDILK